MSISTIIVLAILIGLIIYVITIYNSLVLKRNTFKNAFAQIEVQLKRRYDLIPNLVETAKGYMQHEQETLEKVVEARNASANMLKDLAQHLTPNDVKKFSESEQVLTGALGQLNVVMENYPEIKASQNMMQLSEELTSTENKVSRARQFYNDSATDYKNYRQSFPPNILANMFGHTKDVGLLEYADSAKIQEAPQVSF